MRRGSGGGLCYTPVMKPLIGMLLVISGTILTIPPLYEVLGYLDYDNWPVVPGSLGIACIVVGIWFLMRGGKKDGGFLRVG